jgi:hypothetical protein
LKEEARAHEGCRASGKKKFEIYETNEFIKPVRNVRNTNVAKLKCRRKGEEFKITSRRSCEQMGEA